MLIIFVGPSGSGKNSIMNGVMERIDGIEIMKSCTTRPKRQVVDNSYFYLSEDEFKDKLDNDEFFETEMVHNGIWYGTLKKSVDNVITSDKHYIKDIDVHGSDKLFDYLKKHNKILRIFVDAPDEMLKDRLKKRGETDEKISLRMSRADYERTHKHKYDLCVDNINLNEAVDKVVEFIKKNV